MADREGREERRERRDGRRSEENICENAARWVGQGHKAVRMNKRSIIIRETRQDRQEIGPLRLRGSRERQRDQKRRDLFRDSGLQWNGGCKRGEQCSYQARINNDHNVVHECRAAEIGFLPIRAGVTPRPRRTDSTKRECGEQQAAPVGWHVSRHQGGSEGGRHR